MHEPDDSASEMARVWAVTFTNKYGVVEPQTRSTYLLAPFCVDKGPLAPHEYGRVSAVSPNVLTACWIRCRGRSAYPMISLLPGKPLRVPSREKEIPTGAAFGSE